MVILVVLHVQHSISFITVVILFVIATVVGVDFDVFLLPKAHMIIDNDELGISQLSCNFYNALLYKM